MKRIFALFTLLLIASPTVSRAAEAAPKKPNVLVILADDLGYGDVQCYNPERGKIATPHIDRLAAEGMRFTDGHSSSGVCSPSRYTPIDAEVIAKHQAEADLFLKEGLIRKKLDTAAIFDTRYNDIAAAQETAK